MLSKKYYEAIAATIADRLERENDMARRHAELDGADSRLARDARATIGGVQLLACDLIHVLRSDNPRFDAERFARAAGLSHLVDIHPEWRRRRETV